MEIATESNQVSSDQKICVITGANTGIGKATALLMALHHPDYHIIFACRSIDRAQAAKQEILEEIEKKKKKKDTKTATIELLKLDLSDLALVREFAIEYCKKYTRLDILILNAGVVNSSLQLSKQNLELMFAVNHLGHFLLTNLLLPKMKSSAPSRIVVVASEAHKFSPVLSEDLKELKEAQEYGLTSSMSIYGRSKLCNILFALELDQKLASEDGIDGDTSKSSKPRTVTVNSLHPGTVDTELGRDTPWYLSWIVKPISSLFFKTPEQGAQTSVYVATSPKLENVSGKYFDDSKMAPTNNAALDKKAASKLWDLSVELTKGYSDPLV